MQANPGIQIREMERMMKLQDVILKAMAKKLTWMDAAEIAGMSVRNMQRKRRAKTSILRMPMRSSIRDTW